MAMTLQDRIAQNRSGKQIKQADGTLVQATPDLQQLSGQAGLQAPPTDALSAAALGASPQTQKMMGSPAQVQKAQQLALNPDQSLATVERERQARSQATNQEQAAQKKSKDLQDLGGLGDRVDQFIEGQRQALANAQVQNTQVQVAPATTLTGMPTDPDKLTQLKDAAKSLLANPSDMQSMLAVNQLLGRDANSVVTPQELQQLYESSTDTLSRAGADVVANSLQVDDLIKQGGFGYDLPTLSTLLNVPEAQLAKMSVADLGKAIDAEKQVEFNRSSQNQQQAGSSNLGQAERTLARQQGQELSRTGVRASEADFQRLDQAVQNADQVQFGGKSHSVEDLLKDDTISGIISNYLNSAEGSDTRTQLETTEPGLVKFIQSNQAALSEAAQQMGAGAQQFSQIQTANQGLATVGNTTLSPDLMKQLIPGYGELSATQTNPTDVGLLSALQKLPQAQAEVAANAANALATNPLTADLTPELAKMSPEDIAALHLEQGQNSVPLQKLEQNRQLAQQIQALDPNDPDSIASFFSGGTVQSYADLQTKFQQNKAAQVLGLGGRIDPNLDRDGDGKLDDPATLLATVNANFSPASLHDILSGNANLTAPKASITTPAASSPAALTVLKKLGGAAADGQLTPAEVTNAKFTEDEIYSILDSGIAKNWGDAGKTVQQLAQKAQLTSTGRILAPYSIDKTVGDLAVNTKAQDQMEHVDAGYGITGYTVPQTTIDTLSSTATSYSKEADSLEQTLKQQKAIEGGRRVDVSSIQARINQLRTEAGKMTAEADREAKIRAADMADFQSQSDAIKQAQAADNDARRKANRPLGKIATGLDQAASAGKTVLGLPVAAGEGTTGAIGKAADVVQAACFVAGTRFRMADGTVRQVETLSPHDRLAMGGQTFAVATFVGREMYSYAGIEVSGSHAVYCDGAWKRVRECQHAIRREDLDGSLVYVVWNEFHRMLHESGVIFADYAESDSTHTEIEDRRNLAELSEREQGG